MLSATSNDMMVVSLVGSINKSAILAGIEFHLSMGNDHEDTEISQAISLTSSDAPDPHHSKREDR
jgi:hypothetical protein